MIATLAAMTRTQIAMLAVSLVLFVSFVQRSSARSLLQGSTCIGPIPECAANRCYLQTVSGRMQNVCERCKAGYNTTDDGLSCICMPGTWHSCPTPGNCNCVPCEKGFFCPGGWRQARNYAPEDLKGQRFACENATVVNATSPIITTAYLRDNGLTTKSTNSKRPQDCVPMPGFYLASTARGSQKAALCPKGSYSPGYGRIRQCLRCQSGTEEQPGTFSDNLTAIITDPTNNKLRTNRIDVCQVPPGRYLVQNVVRDCPAGSFRTAWDLTTDSRSRYCFTCPPGVTTNGTKATAPTDCKFVVPGVSMNASDLTNAQALAVNGDPALADQTVTLCDYGTYFPGGELSTGSTCIACPFGTTTQFKGATSVADCQIPPGYFISITATTPSVAGTMQPCPNNVSGQGYYRSGWTSYSDSKSRDQTGGTTACTPCGPGIVSMKTDVDEIGGGNDTSKLVAGSSFSCYIEAGWGMVPTGINADNTIQYSAVLCDNNTYGVANTTFGLQSTPCKPCQRNLITLQAGSTNYTQCVNPGGYGYSPNGATVCPPGTYAPKASMQGCIPCPAGRTTADDPSKQTAITDCYVIPGNGIFVGSSAAPWNPTLDPAMNDTTKAQLPVMPCPVGYWGDGMELDSQCVPCPAQSTTAGEGSSSADACSKCAAGYGRDSSNNCVICPAGQYQPGYLGNDAATGFGNGGACLTCPRTRSVYISSKGNETELDMDGITYRTGAQSRDECVPRVAQLGIDIGTKMFGDDIGTLLSTASPTPATFDGCWAAPNCQADSCCFVQFDYAYYKAGGSAGPKTCKYVNMVANSVPADATSNTVSLLFYKMLPSDAITAASVKNAGDVEAKAMSSGLYARCTLPAAWAAAGVYNSNTIGKRIGPAPSSNQLPSTNLKECKRRCDMMSICWGFTVQGGQCQLRGGFDEQDVRSFFRNPTNSTAWNW